MVGHLLAGDAVDVIVEFLKLLEPHLCAIEKQQFVLFALVC